MQDTQAAVTGPKVLLYQGLSRIMSANEVVILSATRTAIGSLSGGLSSLPAHELGSTVITEALSRAGVTADQVTEVIMGQILTAGELLKSVIIRKRFGAFHSF